MSFTLEKFEKIAPHISNDWFTIIDKSTSTYEINSDLRLAAFLAQCMHESAGFTTLTENLNYSAEALHSLFPKHFTADDAADYARQPERIANHMYANRMGNGDEASGDGYKYRGRGAIQVTGKDNYAECSQFLYHDNRLVNEPTLLLFPEGAIKSACWFWTTHKLNVLADDGSIETISKRVNGGTNGMEDRVKRYKFLLSVLAE